MYQRVKYDLNQKLTKIKDAGLFKEERLIMTSQKPGIHVSFQAGAAFAKVGRKHGII